MRQSPFSPSLQGDFSELALRGLEASHRLGVMRRHLEELAATRPVYDGVAGLGAVLVLVAMTGLALLLY